jgi:hypothetical protein
MAMNNTLHSILWTSINSYSISEPLKATKNSIHDYDHVTSNSDHINNVNSRMYALVNTKWYLMKVVEQGTKNYVSRI